MNTNDEFSYKNMFRDDLLNYAFNWEKLTEDQCALIMQPTEAPENFYCDGELKLEDALPHWVSKLRKSGLSEWEVKQAVKMHFKP